MNNENGPLTSDEDVHSNEELTTCFTKLVFTTLKYILELLKLHPR